MNAAIGWHCKAALPAARSTISDVRIACAKRVAAGSTPTSGPSETGTRCVRRGFDMPNDAHSAHARTLNDALTHPDLRVNAVLGAAFAPRNSALRERSVKCVSGNRLLMRPPLPGRIGIDIISLRAPGSRRADWIS